MGWVRIFENRMCISGKFFILIVAILPMSEIGKCMNESGVTAWRKH